MIGSIAATFAQGSFPRRLATRALVMFGAVWLGGHLMRSYPHDQTLLFPLGSVFPNAVRFSASWKRVGEPEPSGGVTLAFDHAPPLQVRQHASLPNGDYVVTLNIVESPQNPTPTAAPAAAPTRVAQSPREGLQTNLQRHVTLVGGETLIALAAGGF
ncbi:MAG: hypothetical protein ABI548_04030 [Polyangiaceae bacterium]